ncbi:nucleotidyltransferase domain-containing protein [Kutzneria kofuensis]|uniref:nucleotidyltransferase domain-containing protein n=1 Tax=Kutzneria kofuensis TaxID=103725 RepID=UPI0031EF5F37
MSEQLPAGGIELSPAEIDALEARWAASWTPTEVAGRLAGIATPWCVAAGWALDLFRGRQTRAHGDIEIAVPAADFRRSATASPATPSTR